MSHTTSADLAPSGNANLTTARKNTTMKERPTSRRRASSLRGEPPGDTSPSMATMYDREQLQSLTNTTVTVS
jgi:hypothetical protein